MTTHQPSSAGNMVGILVGLAILFTSTVYRVIEILYLFQRCLSGFDFQIFGPAKDIRGECVIELHINVILLCLADAPTLLDKKLPITDYMLCKFAKLLAKSLQQSYTYREQKYMQISTRLLLLLLILHDAEGYISILKTEWFWGFFVLQFGTLAILRD